MKNEMAAVSKLLQNLNQSIIGKSDVVEKLVICLLAEGHVLLEDVPGVGKTTLAKALSNSMNATFGRIQFTPDTLPQDVTGSSVYNMKTGEFEYRPGAIMHQILLADEINRTTPKTQSSLLEAMAERQVTVDGRRFPLPDPFFVIATQNPVEFLGTYPLPEAQMDRFMMRLSVGYPSREEEVKMASLFLGGQLEKRTEAVCTAEDILQARQSVKTVTVKDSVLEYMEEMITATRKEPDFTLGASPRALLALIRASQARAYLLGRDYVKPDDVKDVASEVLLHRLVLSPDARIRGENAGKILRRLVLAARIPV